MSEAFEQLNRRYAGRRAVITGAASGLGRELAERFLAAGWSVGMLDEDAAGLETAAAQLAEHPGRATTLVADVTDADAVREAVDRFGAETGGLEVIVNNAGVALGGSFREISGDDWRWILGVNVLGPVHGCRAAIPWLCQQDRGLIVNVASAAAFISAPQMSGYNASKAAAVSLSETLYGELLDEPVDVCVAMPAFFRTNLLERFRGTDDARETARQLMEHSGLGAAQVADELLAGMARQDFYIVVPRRLTLLWRFKRLLPVTFMRRFKRLREKRLAELEGRRA